MTHRIYYIDAYRREFAARVTERADGGSRIYLDETAFYPTSGGQPHDTGVLGGVRVVDVGDEGDRIAQVLASVLPPPSDPDALIVGTIDWPRRLDHMQQHTGQHLLSAVVDDLYGWNTLSVHFGTEESTVDVDAPVAEATRDRLAAAEQRANEMIGEERPVLVSFEEAATASELRKPSDREGEIRIVTIDGIDRSACGGTHVRSTAGIGALLVGGVEAVRGRARITFVCGERITRRAHADRGLLDRVAAALSSSRSEAPDIAAKLVAELRELRAAHRTVTAELATLRARELLAAADRAAGGRAAAGHAAPGRAAGRAAAGHAAGHAAAGHAVGHAAAGHAVGHAVGHAADHAAAGHAITGHVASASTRCVVDIRESASPDDLRALGQAVSSEPNAAYIGASAADRFVVFAVSAGLDIDAGRVLREALAAEGGRGGGSPRGAQGTLPEVDIEQSALAVARLVEQLRATVEASVRAESE